MFGEWRVFTESRFSMKDWNLGSTGLNPLKIAIETKKPLGAGGGREMDYWLEDISLVAKRGAFRCIVHKC